MKTVLFADDELHNIEGLIEAARAEGLRVLTCRDTTTAFDIIQAQAIDCLIIDIMMDPGSTSSDDPQKAGLLAIDRILRRDRHQSIVCFSVISDPDVINSLKRRGVLFLRKGETSLTAAIKLIKGKASGIYHFDTNE